MIVQVNKKMYDIKIWKKKCVYASFIYHQNHKSFFLMYYES